MVRACPRSLASASSWLVSSFLQWRGFVHVLQPGGNQEYLNRRFHICSKCCIPVPKTQVLCLLCSADSLLSSCRAIQPFLKDELSLFAFSLQPSCSFPASATALREYSILPQSGVSVNQVVSFCFMNCTVTFPQTSHWDKKTSPSFGQSTSGLLPALRL